MTRGSSGGDGWAVFRRALCLAKTASLPVLSFVGLMFLMIVLRRILQFVAMLLFGSGPRTRPHRTLIILGSGGHTKEMLNLSEALSPTFSPRVYVAARSDEMSLDKARELETKRREKGEEKEEAPQFRSVVRIRDVGQGFVTAFLFRAPQAFLQTIWIMMTELPDVILCNGPGICVPFCVIATLLNLLCITSTKIIFIESICRVKSLSLTGRLLLPFAHEFVVQWKDLQTLCQEQYPQYPATKFLYLGRLC